MIYKKTVMGLALLALVGCAEKDEMNFAVEATAATTTEATTAWTAVAPLFKANCQRCHERTGKRIALVSQADYSKNANQVLSAIRSGYMPRGTTLDPDHKEKMVSWLKSVAPKSGTP